MLVLVPFVLHVKGHNLGAVAGSVAALYGAGALILWVLLALPLDWTRSAMDTITIFNSGSDGLLIETVWVLSNLRAWSIPFMVFGLVALILLALEHWTIPYSQRLMILLFWIAHLSVLLRPLGMKLISGFGIPRRYVDYSEAIAMSSRLHATFNSISAFCLIGMLFIAIYATTQRLH